MLAAGVFPQPVFTAARGSARPRRCPHSPKADSTGPSLPATPVNHRMLKEGYDPPPLKWSTLSYGFALKEDRNAEEELQAGGVSGISAYETDRVN